MVAYSFRQQFVAPILSGAKRQTIRADRKRHARAGEEMQLYTGMRTKQCRLIARATCLGTVPVQLNFVGSIITVGGAQYFTPEALEAFARADGFESWTAMRDFWGAVHDSYRWSGILIRWAGLAIP